MAGASIVINQSGVATPGSPSVSRDDLVIGSAVTLSNHNDNGVRSWWWDLLAKPLGSTATISNPSLPTATFTPDVVGTYRLRLTVNGGSKGETDVRVAIVRDGEGFRIPAAGEGEEANYPIGDGTLNDQGYWPDLSRLLETSRIQEYHYRYDVVLQLEALGSSDGVEVGNKARLRSGAIWECVSVAGNSSSWIPIDRVWNVYDYDSRSSPGVLTTAATSGFYQGFMRCGERASAWAEANNTRAIVLVPPGVWGTRFTVNCFRYVNYCIQGEIRYMDDHAGGMIWIRQQDDPHDIRIYGGGVLNANFIGNDNAIAIGQGNGESQPHNIIIEDITIKNCRHRQTSTGLTDVATFGNGGGKGITLQFGAVNVWVAPSVVIEDCDIGVSIEGIVGTNPPNDAVQGSKVEALVTNCRVGAFIFSNQTNYYSNCVELNCTFHNCGVRGGAAPVGDFQVDPISDHFAVICASDVVTVRGRVMIFNDQYASTDPVTLVRGVFTGCNLDVYASVYRLRDVIDHRFWDGFPGSPPKAHDPSEGNRFRVHVNIASSTGMGYLLRSHADYMPIGNDYEFFWRMQDGSVTNWPGTALIDAATVSHAANRIQITNLTNSGMRKIDNKLRIGNGTSFDYATEFAMVFDPPSGSGSTQRLIDFRQGGSSRDELRMSSTGNLIIYSVGASSNVFTVQPDGDLFLGNAATRCVVFGDFRLGGETGPRIAWGTGSPEGVLSAPVGSTFHRTDEGAFPKYYVKEAGTGSSGWVGK